MSSKIIKLRETESTSKSNNGDFKITLDNPVLLKDGDRLAIKSVFLDTVTASGDFIELDEDVNIELDVAKWFINDSKDQKFPAPNAGIFMKQYVPADPDPTNAAGLSAIGDNKLYVACNRVATTANTVELTEIFFDCKPKHSTRMVGGLDLQFQYDAVGGGKGYYGFRVVREKGTDYIHSYGKKHSTSILMEGRSFTLLNTQKELEDHHLDISSITFTYDGSTPTVGTAIASLDTKTFSMTVEKGIYSPTQLGEIITDEMSKIDKSGAIGNDLTNDAFPVNNPFLGTVCQLSAQASTKTSFFCDQEGTQLIRFLADTGATNMKNTDQDRFMGASQVALEYDNSHKKMSFSIMHTPMYVNETTNQNDGVAGIVYDNNRLVDSYSGCSFTRMSPPDFWNLLGFNGNLVSPVQGSTIGDVSSIMGANIVALEFGDAIGQQRTGGYESLDTPVQKNANFRKPNPAGDIATNATVPIFGTRIFSDNFSNEGYYLIELDCGLKQSLVGANGDIGFNSTKVHSIVSTYFNEGSFTSDQGTGSIGYVHRGNPQLLSDINVRVLNSNGRVPSATELGTHNSVFVEVVSAQ
jgi:hypothetical protein